MMGKSASGKVLPEAMRSGQVARGSEIVATPPPVSPALPDVIFVEDPQADQQALDREQQLKHSAGEI